MIYSTGNIAEMPVNTGVLAMLSLRQYCAKSRAF